jgi:hypothetical protein
MIRLRLAVDIGRYDSPGQYLLVKTLKVAVKPLFNSFSRARFQTTLLSKYTHRFISREE